MFKKIAFIVGSAIAVISLTIFAVPAFAQTSSNGDLAFGPGMMRGGRMMWGGFDRGAPGIEGTVSAVSGNTITVTDSRSNTSYTIDASGATVIENGATTTVSNIAVGDTVAVQGTVSGTDVTAKVIRDGAFDQPRDNGFGVFGTVSAINGTTLTVTSEFGPQREASTTYTVDASGATVTKDGKTSAVSDIVVGDNVLVQGAVSGTSITATTIKDDIAQGAQKPSQTEQNPLISGNGEPVVAGNVATISGNTFTLTNKGSVTYTIDASGATVTKDGATSTISSVAVGDSVIVQGTVSGSAITASSVIDQTKPAVSASSQQQNRPFGFMGGIINFFRHLFGF